MADNFFVAESFGDEFTRWAQVEYNFTTRRWEKMNMPKPSDQEIENRFRYHKPDATRIEQHSAVTELMIETAKKIRDLTPAGRGQAVALTKLEEARMWANMAIATQTVPEEG